mgnify:FL=1
MDKPKYKIGSKLIVTRDFELGDIFNEHKTLIKKGTEMHVTSDGYLFCEDGTESKIAYEYDLDGYAVDDIALHVWNALNTIIDVADTAIEYGYEGEVSGEDDSYAVRKENVTNEFKTAIRDALADILR